MAWWSRGEGVSGWRYETGWWWHGLSAVTWSVEIGDWRCLLLECLDPKPSCAPPAAGEEASGETSCRRS